MRICLHSIFFREVTKRVIQALLIAFLALPLMVSAQTPEIYETQKLLAIEGVEDSWFGSSVALDEEIAVIGAPNIGAAAYVFEFISGTWMETAKVLDNEPYYSGFGTSVGVSGRTPLVGIPYYDACGTSSGAAFLFGDTTGDWAVTEELISEPCEMGAIVGSAVSLDDDTAVLGAPGFNDYLGAAFVYERDEGIWMQLAALSANNGTAGDEFGSAVAVSGDYLVVGAPRASGGGWMKGAAYLFERQAGAWVEVQELTASAGENFDYFGSSVAVSGPYVAVGSPQDNYGGSVYLFERIEGSWDQVALLRPLDAIDSSFGASISIEGGAVVIGATGDVVNGGKSGAAYLFERVDDIWTETTRLVSSDASEGDGVGSSVDLSGEIVLVGARMDTDVVLRGGSAYVFDIGMPQPGCEPDVAPLALDFGTIEVNETATLQTTLSNDGEGACDVTAAVVSPGGDFLLNASSPASFTVAAGESADVLVDYAPLEIGDDTGTLELVIADTASQIDVPLTGSAAEGIFDVDITQFRVVPQTIRYRGDRTKTVNISLMVSNEGEIPGDALASVVGKQAGVPVYAASMTIHMEVGTAPQSVTFPAYKPTAAGDIAWTVTVDDGYPDDDEETAETRVR